MKKVISARIRTEDNKQKDLFDDLLFHRLIIPEFSHGNKSSLASNFEPRTQHEFRKLSPLLSVRRQERRKGRTRHTSHSQYWQSGSPEIFVPLPVLTNPARQPWLWVVQEPDGSPHWYSEQ
jgi:hypothetical protein